MDDDEYSEGMEIRWLKFPMDLTDFIASRSRYALKGLVFWDEKGVQHVIGSVNWSGGDTGRRLFRHRVVAFVEIVPFLRDLHDEYINNVGRYP